MKDHLAASSQGRPGDLLENKLFTSPAAVAGCNVFLGYGFTIGNTGAA